MLNWNLMKHPINWFIILMMLLIAAYGGHLLLTYFGASPSIGGKSNEEINRTDISGYVLQA